MSRASSRRFGRMLTRASILEGRRARAPRPPENFFGSERNAQLGPVAKNTGEWLHQWTQKSPNAVSLAERSGQGWREVRYAELLDQVRTVARPRVVDLVAAAVLEAQGVSRAGS